MKSYSVDSHTRAKPGSSGAHDPAVIDCTAQAAPSSFYSDNSLFTPLLEALDASPTARSIVSFAAHRGWSLDLGEIEGGAYQLDIDAQILRINSYGLRPAATAASGYFRHTMILSLVRGLRDIWHLECRQPHYRGLSIESILLLERVRTADCDVIALLAAWELRGAGQTDIWRHLIGSPEGDMALVFGRMLEYEPGAHFSGTGGASHALTNAFARWFEDPLRISACDHASLEAMDEEILEGRHKEIYGREPVSAFFIESLSRLPDRSYYLEGYGREILKNPAFSGLDDDVNQAHFLQINRDLNSTVAGGVAFRDARLARVIFPEENALARETLQN